MVLVLGYTYHRPYQHSVLGKFWVIRLVGYYILLLPPLAEAVHVTWNCWKLKNVEGKNDLFRFVWIRNVYISLIHDRGGGWMQRGAIPFINKWGFFPSCWLDFLESFKYCIHIDWPSSTTTRDGQLIARVLLWLSRGWKIYFCFGLDFLSPFLCICSIPLL